MKTQEELDALKKEVKALNEKLAGLSEDELKVVTGGAEPDCPEGTNQSPWFNIRPDPINLRVADPGSYSLNHHVPVHVE